MPMQEMLPQVAKSNGECAPKVRQVQKPLLEQGRPKEGYIYVIGDVCKRWFKIGRSLNPDSRMRTIRSLKSPIDCAYQMTFHTTDMVLAERILHAKFAQFRTSGEWFRLDYAAFDSLHEQIVLDFPLTVHHNDKCFICKPPKEQ